MTIPARPACLLGLFSFLVFAGPIFTGTQAVAQASAPLLRISTENALDHVQTRAVQRFAERLEKMANGRIAVEFHPEARLFRDRDVIQAISQGRVEMAVPGIWQLDRFVPEAGLFFLPQLYGRETAEINRLRDGEIGARIDRGIEAAFDAKVLGRWIDLGHAQLFTLRRPVRAPSVLRGLIVRTPGGEASAHRLAAQGARPVSIPWPDLPTALRAGSIDGLVTTYETAASARLWSQGIRYAYEDRAYFAQYIPMVSQAFWNRLSPDLKNILAKAWEDGVETARQEAAKAQEDARRILLENGVEIAVPAPADLAASRSALLTKQDDMILALGMDPSLPKRARQILEAQP